MRTSFTSLLTAALVSSPSSVALAAPVKNHTTAPSIQTLSNKLGMDGWAKCAAASAVLTAMSSMPNRGGLPENTADMNANDVAPKLGSIRRYMLANGVPDSNLQDRIRYYGPQFIGAPVEAVITMTRCYVQLRN